MHQYAGVFFAPSILFFTLTGAAQLFGLHQGRPGENYQPPKWLEAVSSIHKDQVLGEHHGPPPGAESRPKAGSPSTEQAPRKEEEHREGTATLILKWFFLMMSIGLLMSTLSGIYMAFTFNRSRALLWGLLIAGAAIPAALIALLA